jgi:pimeloyl-ACP methyl ester carboxylesterase
MDGSAGGIAWRLDGQGVPLVLLHPAFTHSGAFDAVLPHLPGHAVLRVDLPGHGRTPAASRGLRPPPTMPDVAPRLAEWIAERWGSAHVAGVSLGSLVAQDLARRFPECVRSLAAVGGYAVTDPTAAAAQNREMAAWLPKLVFSMPRFRRYLSTVSVHTEAGQAAFRELAQGFRRRDFLAMRGMEQVLDSQRTDSLACPLLIAVGEHDRPLAHELATAWRGVEADARFDVLPGVGHCAQLDDPAGFARWLAAWVAEQEAGTE